MRFPQPSELFPQSSELFPPSGELRDVRRCVLRIALLLFPFVVLQFVELFVLPIDLFTFRVWEAALSQPYQYPGRFYPDMHIRKEEYGDRLRTGGPGMIEKKSVEWFTDARGFRNRPELERLPKHDIVVLGDSNIVGSFLDQKDTLTELMTARGGKSAYSYAIGNDHISLFFNDENALKKRPDLLVVETKAGNWNTNSSYLYNFRQMPDGSLDIVDRKAEIADYERPGRNFLLERLISRLLKQPMWHWSQAVLRTDFSLPRPDGGEIAPRNGPARDSTEGSAWVPTAWTVSSQAFRPLPGEPEPALQLRATGPASYWHTDKFMVTEPGGKVLVEFEARNSMVPSRHRFYVFENGHYTSPGEIKVGRDWQTFEIPVVAKRGSILELQIDQTEDWQWLSIRGFRVKGAEQPFAVRESPSAIAMSAWTSSGMPCEGADEAMSCREWTVTGPGGYVQTPVLPAPGTGGLLIRFNARTDEVSRTFTPLYLLEGANYRHAGQYVFGPAWKQYELLLLPDASKPAKLQIDFPPEVGRLAIRNFQATPVEALQ